MLRDKAQDPGVNTPNWNQHGFHVVSTWFQRGINTPRWFQQWAALLSTPPSGTNIMVSTWFQRGLNTPLVVSTMGRPGVNSVRTRTHVVVEWLGVVSTWRQRGSNMREAVSTFRRRGVNKPPKPQQLPPVVSTWFQRGFNMGQRWNQHPQWCRHGINMGSTWYQPTPQS